VTSLLRILGIFGIVVTMLLLVRDVLRHRDIPEPLPIAAAPHDGFPIPLADLGQVELTMVGASGWTVFDDVVLEDGSISRRPRWKITGMNPKPDSSGILVSDAILESRSPDSKGFVLRTPRLWIPTVAGPSGPTPDKTKRWLLDAPVIEVAEMFEGRAARIESESAELDPRDDKVYGGGHFVLNSGSLRLEGSELLFDPRSQRVDFSPHEGAVSWRLEHPDGGAVSGRSDGGGFMEPVGPDLARVRFDAAEEVVTSLGESSELRTRDLDLLLASGAGDSWVPLRADAAAPTRWQDADRLLIGRASALEFDAQGEPRSLEVGGPVRVFPGDGSFDWATARGGAWFDPSRESVYLHGGFAAQRGASLIQGGWARLESGRLRAGGGIWAIGAQGTARAQSLRELPNGRWLAEQEARFYPTDSQLQEIVAPSIAFDENGDVEIVDGFLATGIQEGKPAIFSGQQLRSRVVGEGRRSHADGDLKIERAGVSLHAERMRQVGAEQLQLFGDPLHGTLRLENGEAQIECGRADWRAGALTMRRAPRMTAPAAALGLAGTEVQLRATEMTLDADGGWALMEKVEFTGDLVGSADEAHWTPGKQISLISWAGIATFTGERLDGTRFHAEAGTLNLSEAGRFLLDKNALVRLRRSTDSVESVLRGDHVEGDLDSGSATGGASIESPEGNGSAQRIEWRRVGAVEEQRYDLHLIGAARLSRDGMSAQGDRIDFDSATGDLIVAGRPDRPAVIELADGQRATGTQLRYNERLRTFSGGQIRLTSP
jgi:hypothetical protein